MRQFFLVFFCGLFVACSSTTVIQSSDKKAEIFVNGKSIGKGSVQYTDSKVIGSKNQVTLKRKGCKDNSFVFSRNEEFDPGACAGGIFVLVPFLWVMKYKPIHEYQFSCQ